MARAAPHELLEPQFITGSFSMDGCYWSAGIEEPTIVVGHEAQESHNDEACLFLGYQTEAEQLLQQFPALNDYYYVAKPEQEYPYNELWIATARRFRQLTADLRQSGLDVALEPNLASEAGETPLDEYLQYLKRQQFPMSRSPEDYLHDAVTHFPKVLMLPTESYDPFWRLNQLVPIINNEFGKQLGRDTKILLANAFDGFTEQRSLIDRSANPEDIMSLLGFVGLGLVTLRGMRYPDVSKQAVKAVVDVLQTEMQATDGSDVIAIDRRRFMVHWEHALDVLAA